MLKHRLWHETRVALFQQSVDTRSETHKLRGQRPRVSFGDRWVQESVLEIFRDDIARFRAMLALDLDEDSEAILASGTPPPLTALRLHNGTVYRWNRACYGVLDGVAHLRIENRVLPAGPTVIDQLANAAFFFGLMSAVGEEFGDVTRRLAFDEARTNFFAAARYGLKAQFTWLDGRAWTAEDLVLEKLLPMAREGLRSRSIDADDVERYLSVLEARVERGRTGAQWVLDSLTGMQGRGTRDQRYRALTAGMYSRQLTEQPVSKWDLVTLEESAKDWRDSFRTVGQVMTSELFTVHPEDSVDLTASLMDWEHIRHVPVEDDDGKLVGIVSHRTLLRLLCQHRASRAEPVAVREIMKPHPITVSPSTETLEAMAIMQRHGVSCLPVVEDDRLVGIVTSVDFMDVAHALLVQHLKQSPS
jgi:CBS domain-containing protein